MQARHAPALIYRIWADSHKNHSVNPKLTYVRNMDKINHLCHRRNPSKNICTQTNSRII